ncbi:uncharacterized protein LOC127449029 isoform X2 [Myxocyprinus asiaticus]|uniref:uncharacterized protein LOC127449029 isoform X2 n=1 Tax=Myxocyprinus asiaticus TaxID=70543 RepID=UPI0022223022|nr:uncharacterized protein LOC127449029 isoform X2 [Myxocyprinus asiaticus]XP_051568078.1 uncharacterized protein LOC127449029 isoform X2 [Myxocyprinus asiaticus]XP_051568079.1 uncharacterized protein LOC127449029 isoform X2 [Myxocyprinus asiaticus]
MVSVIVVVFAVVCLFIPTVRTSEDLWKLECQPTVGIAAQTTDIRCSIRCPIKCSGHIELVGVALTKVKQEKPVFEHIINETPSGDPRFSLVNPVKDPSLQLSDTVFSDEGEYEYYVATNMGEKTERLSISVIAKYRDPVTNSWPESVTDGGPVDLYCNASDGYPAGTIHWFDKSENNLTINSIMTKSIKDTNGSKSVALSSKLPFKSIHSILAPFRCVVFNSKFVKEGEKTFQIMLKWGSEQEHSNTRNIVAGVMVIGSLTAGLLFALLFCRRRSVQNVRQASAQPILSDYDPGKTADPDLETGTETGTD